MPNKQERWPYRIKNIAILLTSGLLWLFHAAGCTSEDPNLVGVGLGQTAIDSALVFLTLDSITSIGVLDIVEQGSPYEGSDVLYLGSTGHGDKSSILVNYDFSIFDHPDSAYYFANDPAAPEGGYLGIGNITGVEILLYMLTWYEPYRGLRPPDEGEAYPYDVKPWLGAQKYYEVWALDEPFDIQGYPGDPPAPSGGFLDMLNLYQDLAYNRGTIRLICQRGFFANAIQERRHVGIKIREGMSASEEPGQPGVLGFASKEMRFAGSTLPPLDAGTLIGPVLRLWLGRQPPQWEAGREWLDIAPSADISTWHELEDPYTDPEDGIMVRTHLRSYPVLNFDLSSLPANVRINSAHLVVVNDTTRSLGHKSVLTCSEIPRSFAPQGRTTVNLVDLEPVVSLLFGNGTWEPEHLSKHKLSFNVTTSLQRYVNSAHDGEFGYLLAAGEYIFPGWRSTPKPDFWFTKWVFHGSTAPPELRPRLEISYTRLDELSGTEEP